MASVSQLTEESLDRFNAMETSAVSSPLRKMSTRASSIGSQESSKTGASLAQRAFPRREPRGGLKFSPLKRFSMAALSTIMSRRMSFASQSSKGKRPKPKQENTYKMVPDEGRKFSPTKVEAVMNLVLQQYLENESYNPGTSGNLATALADVLKNRVKDLNYPRYKIVSHVYIGQTEHNTLEVASRCLWDQGNDSFATATYTNETLFAVATVYGVYFE